MLRIKVPVSREKNGRPKALQNHHNLTSANFRSPGDRTVCASFSGQTFWSGDPLQNLKRQKDNQPKTDWSCEKGMETKYTWCMDALS